MPTPGSETYKSSNPLETRDKSTYSSRKLPELNPGPDVPQLEAPTIISIEPDTLTVPGPDTEVVLTGTGFNENSQIMWNGSAEPTTYIDPEHLSTIAKPSTVEAELPFTLPVAVLNGSILSDPIEFTFTAAEVPPE
jgi:IPT/TIG domain